MSHRVISLARHQFGNAAPADIWSGALSETSDSQREALKLSLAEKHSKEAAYCAATSTKRHFNARNWIYDGYFIHFDASVSCRFYNYVFCGPRLLLKGARDDFFGWRPTMPRDYYDYEDGEKIRMPQGLRLYLSQLPVSVVPRLKGFRG